MNTRQAITAEELEYIQEVLALRIESNNANKEELARCYKIIATINEVLEDYQP